MLVDGLDSTPTGLSHKRVSITRHLGNYTRVRRVVAMNNWANDHVIAAHNTTLNNMTRAVLERVFYRKDGTQWVEPFVPHQSVVDSALSVFKRRLLKRIPPTTPITRQQFAESYVGRKRTIYNNALESLSREPINSKDAILRVFGKVEKHDVTTKPDPAMRVVSPRHPRYNVEVGVFLKPLEHQLYRAVDQLFGSPTILKGLNALEVASALRSKWESVDDPVAVGLDASRFDQSVSLPMLRWEHGVYNAVFNDPELERLLTWQLRNTCHAYLPDGKIKYHTSGTRMSGDMNTSLGNCLIMCALVWSYFNDSVRVPFELANNGDDCVVILSKRHLSKLDSLSDWFSSLGFSMKVEPAVDIFERIEFCHTQPVFDGMGWIMVRDPHVAVAKDSVSIKPLPTSSAFRKWYGSVGEAGLSLTGGIPIFQNVYQKMVDISMGERNKYDALMECGLWHWGRGMHRKFKPITQDTRFSFYLAFDILPDMQEDIESFYDAQPIEVGVPVYRPCDRPMQWM